MLQCCILTLLMLFLLSEDAEGYLPFIQQPVSQNVSLGSEPVIFNCTAKSLGYHWLVNGETLNTNENKNRLITKSDIIVDDAINLKIHLLTVPVNTMINDGITITCYIYTSLANISEVATLQIQGLLGPVTELHTVWVDSSSILVSFTPPYSLDGVPIRNYTIELDSSTVYTTNTTSTVISVNNSCTNHNITVTAWNDVGQGNETQVSLKKGTSIPQPAMNTSVSVQQHGHSKHTTLITYVNTEFPFTPDTITVFLYSNTAVDGAHCLSCTLMNTLNCDNDNYELTAEGNTTQVAVNITEYIQPGYQYYVTVSLTNCIGTTNSSQYSFSISKPSPSIESVTSSYSGLTLSGDMSSSSVFKSRSESNGFEASSSAVPPSSPTRNPFDVNINAASDDNSWSSWMPGLVIALCVFSGTLVLLSLIIVILMATLMKYKKKNNRLKFAEIDARQQQRHAQVILNQLTVPTTPQFEENGYYERTPSLPVENPQYENLDDIQSVIANDSKVDIVQCPAYASVPMMRPK